MPKVMQAKVKATNLLGNSLERMGHDQWVQWLPIRLAENKIALSKGRPYQQPFSRLMGL